MAEFKPGDVVERNIPAKEGVGPIGMWGTVIEDRGGDSVMVKSSHSHKTFHWPRQQLELVPKSR